MNSLFIPTGARLGLGFDFGHEGSRVSDTLPKAFKNLKKISLITLKPDEETSNTPVCSELESVPYIEYRGRFCSDGRTCTSGEGILPFSDTRVNFTLHHVRAS